MFCEAARLLSLGECIGQDFIFGVSQMLGTWKSLYLVQFFVLPLQVV